ncbi:amino acid ABC transporter ATP-binding/permease protein [Salinispira pacifica]|uniref:Transport ATP-binding protein CydC n=1 Tax=Salinispira pacifica TaxID=1307761 RepID=V5WJS0_9SPIO|nr:ATP-binding cassette domain-containing protein [Salinispira pacifica]AHC15421.1 Transport ATP-binding protein CydC [Salinispira pacifica]
MNMPLIRMLAFIRGHIYKIALSSLLRIVNVFAGSALFGLSGYLLADVLISRRQPQSALWISLAVIGILKAAARYAEQISGHNAAFNILDILRQKLFHAFSEKDADSLASSRTGDLAVRAMGDVDLIEIFYAHTLAPALSAVLFILIAAAAAAVLVSPVAAAAVAAMYLCAGIGIPVLFQAASSSAAQRYRGAQAALSADLSESLAGIQDLQAFAAVDAEQARHRRSAEKAYGLNQGLQMLSGFRDVLVDLLLGTSLIVLIFLAARENLLGTDPLSWALVCALAGGFSAILGINRAVDDLPKSRAAAQRILQVLDEPSDSPAWTASSADGDPSGYDISVENLSFSYGNNQGIRDISFRLKQGEHLLITGQTGSGKTTLATAILGLLEPEGGCVRIGGIDVRSIEPSRRFALITAARQNLMLVRGSAMENIELGVPAEGTPVPGHALEIAEIPQLMTELPDGEDTLVSGTDEQISGGQRRRIGLAAALARSARIMVLDEAFAGLDDDLRKRIRGKLLDWARREGISIIELSHDLSDSVDTARIAVLAGGSLIESGSYDELMERRGAFWDMAVL